jgi:hypothetical protein
MRIAFVGSQANLTDYQQDKLRLFLDKLGCTEFMTNDLIGGEYDAACIAFSEGIKQFTFFPVENIRSRGNMFDKDKVMNNNRIVTPYIKVMPEDVMCRWFPVQAYMGASHSLLDEAQTIIACPKEFRNNQVSATWKRIRHAWKLIPKKDVIVIAPINRSESEETAVV